MNENLNLCKILRDCPKGTKLYSPIFGEVTLLNICADNDFYPISVFTSTNDGGTRIEGFTSDGRYSDYFNDTECVLFPSKDNRDWSTFKAEQPKPEPKFKPFDRVLVRNGNYGCWEIDFFDHYNQSENFPYRGMTRGWHKQCIPYEGNEALLGTVDKPKR